MSISITNGERTISTVDELRQAVCLADQSITKALQTLHRLSDDDWKRLTKAQPLLERMLLDLGKVYSGTIGGEILEKKEKFKKKVLMADLPNGRTY